MKKTLFLLFVAVMFTSCSTNSDSEDTSFFNLNEGNLWVYKRYASNDGINYSPTNSIDSVRITGDTLINSLSYAKLIHRRYNAGVLSAIEKECLRVDSQNHLVNQNGMVYHPGIDSEFYNIRPVIVGGTINVGSIAEELLAPFTTTVEEVDYFVYCYYGRFTSSDSSIPDNFIFSQYKEGLGLVCQRCATVAGPYSTEDRLIYYELN
jgi:hypothetical protein